MTGFFIDVITTPRDNPNIIEDARKINYDNSRSRDWLAKHSNWALRNGLAVHTAACVPQSDTDGQPVTRIRVNKPNRNVICDVSARNAE